MKKVLVLSCILFLFSFVSSEMTISEPLDLYNLGDKLYITLNGVRGLDSGNLDIALQCKNITLNLVRIPANNFPKDQDTTYSVPYKILNREDLGIENITRILGSCQIISKLGESSVSSKSFTISNQVKVSASLDKTLYDPGEGIRVDVEAIKANNDLFEGTLKISNATDLMKEVVGGKASAVFSLSETAEAGIYFLVIEVYDSDKKGILNYGKTVVNFEIAQIPTSIVPSLSSDKVFPGQKLEVSSELFDQSGREMKKIISVRIVSPKSDVYEGTIEPGNVTEFKFPENATPGIWKAVFKLDGLIEEREFKVPPVQKIDMNIEDNVLTVKNIGNTLYNKTITVTIGPEKKQLKLNIEVGEERKFSLKAPRGEYEVLVDDGETKYKKTVFLTGSAVSIKNAENAGIFEGYSIIWTLLIIVLAVAGVILFSRFRKTKTIAKEGTSIRTLTETSKKKEKSYSQVQATPYLSEKKAGVAESSIVNKGEKNPSSVIALKLKNFVNLKDETLKKIQSIIEESAKRFHGYVDYRGEMVYIVFNPITTRSYNNELLASKSAFQLYQKLKEWNRKYSEKIEFNIGISSGELIASMSQGKLKYSGVGNIIPLAKRIADSDSQKLLVSDSVRRKMLRDLRIIKAKDIGDNPIYEVLELKDRAANEAKLKDLLRRM